MNLFWERQLKIVQDIAQYRTYLGDGFFEVLNFFDSLTFYILLVIVVWMGIGRKWGIRLFFLVMTSGLINSFCKHWLEWPRPTDMDPALGLVNIGGYGFPSGGAQGATVLAGFLILHWKSRWAWPLGALYVLFMAFSRVYLGVHFPIDILGGFLIGLIVLMGYKLLYALIEDIAYDATWGDGLLYVTAIFLVLAGLLGPVSYRYVSTMVGVGWGLCLCSYFRIFLTDPINGIERIGRISLTILGVFGLEYISSQLRGVGILSSMLFGTPIFVLAFAGLWLSFLVNPICKILKLAHYE